MTHSRRSIPYIGRRKALPNSPYVHLPAQSRKRGLPAIGFKIVAPDTVLFSPTDPSGPQNGVLVEAIERRAQDGKLVGMMEIAAFSAALVIDRDGVLQEVAAAGAEHLIQPPSDGRLVSIGAVEYPGGAGFRADVVVSRDANDASPALPCVSAIAIAAVDFAVSAGLYIVLRSVTPDWEAGAAMLESLTFLR